MPGDEESGRARLNLGDVLGSPSARYTGVIRACATRPYGLAMIRTAMRNREGPG